MSKYETKMKSIVERAEDTWRVHTVVGITVNIIIAVIGIILTTAILNARNQARVNDIQSTITGVFGDTPILGPIAVLFVLIALIYLFAILRTQVADQLDTKTRTKMAGQGERNIMYPLLFQLFFLFGTDLTKSCSAEAIMFTIFVMIAASAVELAIDTYKIGLYNAEYSYYENRIHDDKQQEILDMLQSIYNDMNKHSRK